MSCGTLVLTKLLTLSRTGLLPSLIGLSRPVLLKSRVYIVSPQPREASPSVWPLSRSLAATQEIVIYFLFLRVLRCFSSPRALRYTMDSCNGDRLLTCRVPPFRYLRIVACLRLPVAFRSLPRLSSAYGALASTLCSY